MEVIFKNFFQIRRLKVLFTTKIYCVCVIYQVPYTFKLISDPVSVLVRSGRYQQTKKPESMYGHLGARNILFLIARSIVRSTDIHI